MAADDQGIKEHLLNARSDVENKFENEFNSDPVNSLRNRTSTTEPIVFSKCLNTNSTNQNALVSQQIFSKKN